MKHRLELTLEFDSPVKAEELFRRAANLAVAADTASQKAILEAVEADLAAKLSTMQADKSSMALVIEELSGMVHQGEALQQAVVELRQGIKFLESQAANTLSSIQDYACKCDALLSSMAAGVNKVKEMLLNIGSTKQEADRLLEAAYYLAGTLAVSTNALIGGSAKLFSQEADPAYQGIKMIPIDSWTYQRKK